jgi:hypothetical protein
MTNRFRTPGMYLAYFVQAAIAFNVLLAVLFKPEDVVIGLILFLIALIIYVFSWKTKIMFPWFVYFLVSLAVLIHTSGYIQGRYLTYINWDMLAHFVSGTIVALIGFLVILFWDKIKNYNLDAGFIGIFIVFFGCVFEYFWEIWEFCVDTFFGGSAAGLMQANNADTMTDMIFVLISSLIVAIGCYYYLKRYGKENIFHNMVKDSTYLKKFNV